MLRAETGSVVGHAPTPAESERLRPTTYPVTVDPLGNGGCQVSVAVLAA
jgi:hypothetical protein